MNQIQIEMLLNEALEHFSYGVTVEECLAHYPKEAAELEPLLRLAHAISTSLPGPRSTTKQEILVRITEKWEKRRIHESERFRFPDLSFLQRPLAFVASVAIVLVIASWGTTTAAADTVPGDLLYPVKTAKEQVILVAGSSSYHKARTHARLSAERAREMEILAARTGTSSQIERLSRRMANHTRKAALLNTATPERIRLAKKETRRESRRQVRARKALRRAQEEVHGLLVRQKRLQDRRFQGFNAKQQKRLQYGFQKTQEQLRQAIQTLEQLESEQGIQRDSKGNVRDGPRR